MVIFILSISMLFAGMFLGYRIAIEELFDNSKIKYVDVVAYNENMWSIIWNNLKKYF